MTLQIKRRRHNSITLLFEDDEDFFISLAGINEEDDKVTITLDRFQISQIKNLSPSSDFVKSPPTPNQDEISKIDKKEKKLDSTVGNDTIPSIEEVASYLYSKDKFIHDSAELQMKFFGRKINSRKERKLYNSFYNVMVKARELIEKEHEGNWIEDDAKKMGRKKVQKVYRFVKGNEKNNIFKTNGINEWM